MTTKLALYNGALRECGELKIATLTENREPRRVLDDVYDGALKFCLEAGFWNFAIRTVKIEADGDIVPGFGYRSVFQKPEDWVRTAALSANEYCELPLIRYQDESAYWLADEPIIYVRYVSDDAAFGMDLGGWPARYIRYVELYLASRICKRLSQNASRLGEIMVDLKQAKKEALNSDAMNDASPRFLPTGSWVRSRGGGNSRNHEQG